MCDLNKLLLLFVICGFSFAQQEASTPNTGATTEQQHNNPVNIQQITQTPNQNTTPKQNAITAQAEQRRRELESSIRQQKISNDIQQQNIVQQIENQFDGQVQQIDSQLRSLDTQRAQCDRTASSQLGELDSNKVQQYAKLGESALSGLFQQYSGQDGDLDRVRQLANQSKEEYEQQIKALKESAQNETESLAGCKTLKITGSLILPNKPCCDTAARQKYPEDRVKQSNYVNVCTSDARSAADSYSSQLQSLRLEQSSVQTASEKFLGNAAKVAGAAAGPAIGHFALKENNDIQKREIQETQQFCKQQVDLQKSNLLQQRTLVQSNKNDALTAAMAEIAARRKIQDEQNSLALASVIAAEENQQLGDLNLDVDPANLKENTPAIASNSPSNPASGNNDGGGGGGGGSGTELDAENTFGYGNDANPNYEYAMSGLPKQNASGTLAGGRSAASDDSGFGVANDNTGIGNPLNKAKKALSKAAQNKNSKLLSNSSFEFGDGGLATMMERARRPLLLRAATFFQKVDLTELIEKIKKEDASRIPSNAKQ